MGVAVDALKTVIVLGVPLFAPFSQPSIVTPELSVKLGKAAVRVIVWGNAAPKLKSITSAPEFALANRMHFRSELLPSPAL